MLEQAVYAGRNHTSILAVALALLFSTPAQAADVVHVELGSSITGLIAGPDGGAWVKVTRPRSTAIGRVRPDGRFTETRVGGEIAGGAPGPDGAAWYMAGGRELLRVDGDGAATTVTLSPATGPLLTDRLAAGPGGALWVSTTETDQIARVGPNGAVTYIPSGRRGCEGIFPEPFGMALASDGAMWVSDGCKRLLRDGIARTLVASAYTLEADRSGGVWIELAAERAIAHARADGSVGYITPPRDAFDLAVAPDGAAWLTFGDCTLARVAPDGAISTIPAPIPATTIAIDPGGGIWLANRARLARGLDGTCDGEAPRVRAPSRMSLPALARGIAVRVDEPAILRVNSITHLGRSSTSEGYRPRLLARGGMLRYRLPRARLRQIARARNPRITLYVTVEDREGNVDEQTLRVQVAR